MKKLAHLISIVVLAISIQDTQAQPATVQTSASTVRSVAPSQQFKARNPNETDMILNDLKREVIITADDNIDLSFKLNSSGMVVNGKRLAANVHKRYKVKYLPNHSRKEISFKREIN